MSGDESEEEGRQKVVRRVKLHFLNPEFANLYSSVDSYPRQKKHREGPQPLKRFFPANKSSTDKTRKPVKGLPVNWYNRDWYKTYPGKHQLKAKSIRPIPKLVSLSL